MDKLNKVLTSIKWIIQQWLWNMSNFVLLFMYIEIRLEWEFAIEVESVIVK